MRDWNAVDDATKHKMDAIASVLWLMEDHYRMIKAGRLGSCIRYERPPDGTEQWRPPIIEEFEDWPVEHVIAWVMRQKKVSRRYRLWPVGLALQRLERERPEQAVAVKVRYVEIPPPNWYEPSTLEERAREGLLFMAEDVPGDVPEWMGERPKSKTDMVREMVDEGCTTAQIARRLDCSTSYVRRLKRTLSVRLESKCTL